MEVRFEWIVVSLSDLEYIRSNHWIAGHDAACMIVAQWLYRMGRAGWTSSSLFCGAKTMVWFWA